MAAINIDFKLSISGLFKVIIVLPNILPNIYSIEVPVGSQLSV